MYISCCPTKQVHSLELDELCDSLSTLIASVNTCKILYIIKGVCLQLIVPKVNRVSKNMRKMPTSTCTYGNSSFFG